MELLHRGFIFKEPVVIYVVADGTAQRVAYAPDFFTFGPSMQPPPAARAMVVHALLDSVSTTGVYRFTIRPGDAP